MDTSQCDGSTALNTSTNNRLSFFLGPTWERMKRHRDGCGKRARPAACLPFSLLCLWLQLTCLCFAMCRCCIHMQTWPATLFTAVRSLWNSAVVFEYAHLVCCVKSLLFMHFQKCIIALSFLFWMGIWWLLRGSNGIYTKAKSCRDKYVREKEKPR